MFFLNVFRKSGKLILYDFLYLRFNCAANLFDKVFYLNKLKEAHQERIDMQSNQEKFAREHYYMKAADEDVFVIEKENKK